MASHAPGPWVTYQNRPREVMGSDNVTIADCRYTARSLRSLPMATANANARLISKAPEMLELLEHLEDRYDDSMANEDYERIVNLISEAKIKT